MTSLLYPPACVHNVIAYDAAYCLYPRATLEDYTSLVLHRHDDPSPAIAKKYMDRGFQFLLTPHNGDLAFAYGSRCTGDSRCWTIPLDTARLSLPRASYPPGRPLLSHDPCFAMNWHVRQTLPRLVYGCMTSLCLYHWYIVGDDQVWRAFQTLLILYGGKAQEEDFV